MVVDGQDRLERHLESCSRTLRRNQVIGTPHAVEVFALVRPRTMHE